MSKIALLVIDVQAGVVSTCHDVPRVVDNIEDLVLRARMAGILVIWVQHEDAGLVRDSAEWEIVPTLPSPLEEEVRIYKSYRDTFTAGLEEILRKYDVGHLVLTGAQSDMCVRSTAHGALVRGFSITLLSDAHTTEDCEYNGVKISAEQIIQHTNAYFDDLVYSPGVTARVLQHDAFKFEV